MLYTSLYFILCLVMSLFLARVSNKGKGIVMAVLMIFPFLSLHKEGLYELYNPKNKATA